MEKKRLRRRFWQSSRAPSKVTATAFPRNIAKSDGDCYRDAFLVTAQKANLTAKQTYFAIFAELPSWVKSLLMLRNKIARRFGFAATDNTMGSTFSEMKTGAKAGFLRYQLVNDEQVITTSEEPNMAIWLTVLRVAQDQFIVATEVELKTVKGRVYMALIKPFHRFIAPFCIRYALKKGRI